jgi:ABC-type transport system substrate-binding protein
MSDPTDVDPTNDVLRRLPYLSRRGFVLASGATALSVFLAACGKSDDKSTAGASGAGTKNALGLALPDGAAPAADQYYVQAFDSTGASYKAMDFYETVYSRAPLADQFNIPLVRLDKDYKIQPGAATAWEQAADKKSWTFHLKPGIMWSDGKELTAADFVETMRYSADPKHAWDFSWFWSGVIKNYSDAVAGKAAIDSIGVKQGKDKYTLVIETEGVIAYIPSACLYTTPLSAAGLDKYGSGTYNINPATVITCGPYTLKTFDPTAHVVLSPNSKYTGPYAPPITTLIGKIYSGGDNLPRFQTGEIDSISLSPLDLKIAAGNAKTKDLHLYKNPNDFEIWYTFFDTTKAPFDNVKVRQALAHAVDRDPLIDTILAPLATPAYGYLTPGYPFAVEDPLKPLTNYDPEKAKSLLAEAGYPGGKGFPEVTFSWWANAVSKTETVVQALTENWNKTLGINIKLQELDKTTFYDRMNKKPTTLQMGFVSYGMDFFDASNMLSVYKSNGRHNWNNKEYDALLVKAAAESDPAKRQDLYTQAQVLLTGDAPGVFVFHLLYGTYFAPYMTGKALEKNTSGFDGLQWPGYSATSTSLQELYVTSAVSSSARKSVKDLI